MNEDKRKFRTGDIVFVTNVNGIMRKGVIVHDDSSFGDEREYYVVFEERITATYDIPHKDFTGDVSSGWWIIEDELEEYLSIVVLRLV